MLTFSYSCTFLSAKQFSLNQKPETNKSIMNNLTFRNCFLHNIKFFADVNDKTVFTQEPFLAKRCMRRAKHISNSNNALYYISGMLRIVCFEKRRVNRWKIFYLNMCSQWFQFQFFETLIFTKQLL